MGSTSSATGMGIAPFPGALACSFIFSGSENQFTVVLQRQCQTLLHNLFNHRWVSRPEGPGSSVNVEPGTRGFTGPYTKFGAEATVTSGSLCDGLCNDPL